MNFLRTPFILVIASASLLMSGCANQSNLSNLQKTLDQNPQVVFDLIEKHPEQFFATIKKAQADMANKEAKAAEEQFKKESEAQFSNPLKPIIDDKHLIIGKADAPITIVAYTDFQCPYCAQGEMTVQEIQKIYGDKVRVVVKELPLEFHPRALPTALFFEAVMLQNKETAAKLYPYLFANQQILSQAGDQFLFETAQKFGVNMDKLKNDIKKPEIQSQIALDINEAHTFGIDGTPGYIINGVALKGAYPIDAFKEVIDKHLSAIK